MGKEKKIDVQCTISTLLLPPPPPFRHGVGLGLFVATDCETDRTDK